MPKDDEIINAALSGEPNTDEVNYLTLLSSYDGKLTLLQWLKKSVAFYQQGIDQFSADHNQVELNRLNISDLEGRVYTLEQKPACLPLTGGTLNGGLDVMGRLAIAGKVGQDPMLEVGEGVADSHLFIQANKSLYSRIFTPTNSAYTFAETMRDGVFEWTIESRSNNETKTATYRLPYGTNMPTGNHFLALHDEVTAEATTRNNQITGLRDAVTGVNNTLSEEVTNRENADTALSNRIAANDTQISKLGIGETKIEPTLPVISPFEHHNDDSSILEITRNDPTRPLAPSTFSMYVIDKVFFLELELSSVNATSNHSAYNLTIEMPAVFAHIPDDYLFNGCVCGYENNNDYRPVFGRIYLSGNDLYSMDIYVSPSNSNEEYSERVCIRFFADMSFEY